MLVWLPNTNNHTLQKNPNTYDTLHCDGPRSPSSLVSLALNTQQETRQESRLMMKQRGQERFSETTTRMDYKTASRDIVRYTILDNNTTILTVKPLRDPSTKRNAQTCVKYGNGRIYMKHLRVIRIVSDMVLGGKGQTNAKQEKNKEEQQLEHPNNIYRNEFPYFNSELLLKGNKEKNLLEFDPSSIIFLTSVQHPIDRIESMYWFEGRWPRTCGKKYKNEKVKDNTTAVASFHNCIHSIHAPQTNFVELKQYPQHDACGTWISVDNYYIQQLLGVDAPQSTGEFHTLLQQHHQKKLIKIIS